MTPVTEGEVLLGKYVVEKVLGMGGMGVVVAAHHLQLDERVALKFLLPDAAANPQVVARFLREARAAAKIKSEHVTRVFDVGTMENGSPFLVMEYLDGQDLAALIASSGPCAPDVAVDYVLQACEAIAEAHAAGVVHRDLKPHNLFLSRRADGSPCVKVLDFGISKATASPAAAMTSTAAMMGSPLYMSPEQMVSARDVDPRSDIWALGIILYELLAGKTPFDAETMPQLVLQVTQHPPRMLRVDRPDAPPGLEAAINRCLEKSPAARYQNVADLAADLAIFVPPERRSSVIRISRVLGGSAEASRAPAQTDSAAATAASPVATQGSWGSTRAEGRGFPMATAALAVGVVTLVGAFAWAGLRFMRSSDGASASASSSTESASPSPAAIASAARAEATAAVAAELDASRPTDGGASPSETTQPPPVGDHEARRAAAAGKPSSAVKRPIVPAVPSAKSPTSEVPSDRK
jgi:serine/threonine-protein kinase